MKVITKVKDAPKDKIWDEWPDQFYGPEEIWIEVTYRMYNDALNCIWPARWDGCGNTFAMGEPANHMLVTQPDGQVVEYPVYAMFIAIGGMPGDEGVRYFMSPRGIHTWDPVCWRSEIRHQFQLITIQL